MPYTEHSVFRAPSDHSKIWRFTEFAKFYSMVSTGSLYFSRLDKLEDQFEGHFSKAIAENDQKVYDSLDVNDQGKNVIKWLYAPIRKSSFVNCWHMNEYESELLWSRYSFMDRGVAIQSTFQRLKRSFKNYPRGVYIGKINYIDWEKEMTPIGNIMNRIVYKRKNFQDEKELRAVVYYQRESPKKSGLYVPTDLQEIIETVYVSPKSSNWFRQLVKSTISNSALKIPVVKSLFSEKPFRPTFLRKHSMY